MGAWDFIRPHLIEVSGRPVQRVARPRSASPAEGSATLHAHNQQLLVNQAFGTDTRAAAGQTGEVAEKARRDEQLTSTKG
jgi:hypothetical protein